MKKQETQNEVKDYVVTNLKGVVKFPYVDSEDDRKSFSCKLALTENEMKKVDVICNKLGEDMTVSSVVVDDDEMEAIRVKTSFEIPVYDRDGGLIEDDENYPIYDGARAILRVQLKKYEYREKKGRGSFTKKGVTAYLLGALIVEQGTPTNNHVTFEDLSKDMDLENDGIEL